ncbi:MAG: endonuclease domain-containing protein [Candidatus Kerfeldbacteria bacterium]|nr:endonuclease domain-containing protein [Candidatus Kerfeldbacteria bacterium]
MRYYQSTAQERQLQKQLQILAQQLRYEPTLAEQLLWQYLKGYKTFPVRFRRQYVIHTFIVDFCCVAKKLVIELDGAIHNKQRIRDHARDDILKQYGFTVLRFSNEAVLYTINAVVEKISSLLKRRGIQGRG